MSLYRPTYLQFSLWERCNLRCLHCCVPPGRGDVLPLEVTVQCIEAAPELGITQVGFTGGEPMLDTNSLARVMGEAVRCGLKVGDVATNGVWWSDRPQLEGALVHVRDAWFGGHFNLSVDAFHAGGRVGKQAAFIRAALEVFGATCALNSAETPEHPALPVLVRLAQRLGGALVEDNNERGHIVFGEDRIDYFRYLAADVGQAWRGGARTCERWFGEFDCYGHDMICVDPRGRVRFCSGFASPVLADLSFGHVTDGTLGMAVTAARQRALIRLLCEEGPAGLRRVIEERQPDAFPQPWMQPCSFCYHCLTDPRLRGILRDAGVLDG